MINIAVAFGLLLAIMLAHGALVRNAPNKITSVLFSVFFSMILVGANFPALLEASPVLVGWSVEFFTSTKDALMKVM